PSPARRRKPTAPPVKSILRFSSRVVSYGPIDGSVADREISSLPSTSGFFMPVINRVAEFHADITAWRRQLHANPELLYDVHETAAFVAEKLKSFGVDEIVTGLGRTGVVGVIRGKGAS